MYTAKWCNEHLNGGSIGWKEVKGEIIEVIESKSLAEVKEEVADVLYFVYSAIEGKFGINLPMIGVRPTIDKIINRLETWRGIFDEEGLDFHQKYLVNGSNHLKPVKVEKALQLARSEQMN